MRYIAWHSFHSKNVAVFFRQYSSKHIASSQYFTQGIITHQCTNANMLLGSPNISKVPDAVIPFPFFSIFALSLS